MKQLEAGALSETKQESDRTLSTDRTCDASSEPSGVDGETKKVSWLSRYTVSRLRLCQGGLPTTTQGNSTALSTDRTVKAKPGTFKGAEWVKTTSGLSRYAASTLHSCQEGLSTMKQRGTTTLGSYKMSHGNSKIPKTGGRTHEKFGAEYAFSQMFSREHWLRKQCIRVVSHRYFDQFVIVAIVANSIIMGLADFSVVGDNLNPASEGKRFEDGMVVDGVKSTWNFFVEMSETPFAIIFGVECALKIMAMGFIRGKGSYLSDSWNRLDFVVVISSTFTLLPTVPSVSNVSSLRTIRVLRPLRSLSVVPGMRRLISSLLKALPALGKVVLLQMFVFFIFGILGVRLFGGTMSRRCRMTEFPVQLPLNTTTQEPIWPVPDDYLNMVIGNAAAYRCLDAPLLDYEDDALNYTKETSPWNTPQDCFWPLDESAETLCAGPGKPGVIECLTGQTCGSDYDAYGNQRFSNDAVMAYALNTPSLNWGYTRFDNIGMAFFTIFQAITQEGWTTILYMVMESSQPLVGVLFFGILLVFASFFVINLTLAVISEEFSLDDRPRGLTAKEKKALKQKAKEQEAANQPQGHHWLTAIVSHHLFGAFIMTVILANTVVLSLDHYPIPKEMESNLEMANFVLSFVLIIELIVKLAGLGLREYARDKFNLFDAFIVTMGVIETIVSPPSFLVGEDPQNVTVSVLRSFRLFRVFKLARGWKSFRELLQMIARAVASIANFVVLLTLFIYIYALVGVQFFAHTMRFDDAGNSTAHNIYDFWRGTVPRNNFDTLHWSILTVFQVITGENWNMIMYDAMRGNHPAVSVYFISLVIMGDFVLMNLFLALLLDNFASDGSKQAREKESLAKKLKSKMSSVSMKVAVISKRELTTSAATLKQFAGTIPGLSRLQQPGAQVEDTEFDKDVRTGDQGTLMGEPAASAPSQGPICIDLPLQEDIPNDVVCGVKPRPRVKALANSRSGVIPKSRRALFRLARGDSTADMLLMPSGKSLLLFSETSRIRRLAFRLSIHPLFESIVFGCIVVSSVALAADNPLANPQSATTTFLKGLDQVFAVIFTLEMMIKVVALGLVAHKGSYLRSGWNVMDGLIVVSSLMLFGTDTTSSVGGSSLKSLRMFRGLRTFRPLRMIGRHSSLKLVASALIGALPEVLNVFILCMLLYLIFSIVAVNYLKGTFNACSGDAFNALSDEQRAFLERPSPWSELLDYQREWFSNGTCANFLDMPKPNSAYICGCWGLEWSAVIPQNFDNVGNAMITLFEISTTEGWADVMMAAIDATEIGMQPIRDNNMMWSLFFVVFLVVGGFFIVNLFVGVIIDNFNRMKATLGGHFLLTAEQKRWFEAQEKASRVGPIRVPKPPRHRVRRFFFHLVQMQRFEWFIMICIIVNALLMSTQYFGEASVHTLFINVVNEMVAVVFAFEAAMKIAAYGWDYFKHKWNRFDLFVVLSTLVSVVIEILQGESIRSLALLVRIFRITRILRLVKVSSSIRQIMQTLSIALPGISSITSILFLMIFIYTTMGVQMFAKVSIDSSANLNSIANFQDFGNGFLFLLRAATGEAWNSCMHDLAYTGDTCVDDPPYDPNMCGFNNFEGCVPLNGCGSPVAYVFFCTFTLLVTYVMLNLTIAVILESFSQSHEEIDPLIEPKVVKEFQTKWATMDPKASGFIPVEKLLVLVNILEPPLGKFGIPFTMIDFFRYMRGLYLPMYIDGTVNFKDVLLAMTREMVKETRANDPDGISEIGQPQDDELDRPHTEFFAHEFFAIRRVERAVTQWLHRKRQREKEEAERAKLQQERAMEASREVASREAASREVASIQIEDDGLSFWQCITS